jgi:hypothetical protein
MRCEKCVLSLVFSKGPRKPHITNPYPVPTDAVTILGSHCPSQRCTILGPKLVQHRSKVSLTGIPPNERTNTSAEKRCIPAGSLEPLGTLRRLQSSEIDAQFLGPIIKDHFLSNLCFQLKCRLDGCFADADLYRRTKVSRVTWIKQCPKGSVTYCCWSSACIASLPNPLRLRCWKLIPLPAKDPKVLRPLRASNLPLHRNCTQASVFAPCCTHSSSKPNLRL